MGSHIAVNSFHGKRPSIRAFEQRGSESGGEFLDDPFGALTIDQQVLTVDQQFKDLGRLQNGLSYYVRRNSKPNRRAALALAVKVGSVLEEGEERGVAHIIEHLAFSATKNYENHEIVKFIESIGGEYSAHTSPDETVYDLQVPTDKPELLSQAISILAEFSTEIRIADEDLEKERGVVMEEYRSRRNAAQRTEEAHWRLSMEDSKYARRLPIGLEKVIRGVTSKTVKQFYQKWYHLSRMAVIAVGDFPDTKGVVDLIETHFGQKTSASDPSPVPKFHVPFHKEPRYSCYVDSEATGSGVVISYKMPANKMKNARDSLVESMFLTALNRRFLKISSKKNPPYFSCSLNGEGIVPSVRAYKMNSFCKETETLKALESMLIEVARVRLHGFSKHEISVARAEIETAYLKRDQRQSTSLRNDYLQYFIRNEPVIGDYDAQTSRSLLHYISASDMSRFAEKLETSCSCIILTVQPQASATIIDLRKVVQNVSNLEEDRSISSWDIIEQIPKEIVDIKPNPGNIVDQRENSNIGAIELILSNGMKVCYKCTNYSKDQILFSGISKGGLSELSESEYLSSKMGASFAQEIGQFGHKPSVLADMLAAKKVRVSTEVGYYSRNFYGHCSPSNLETTLQLVYQLFLKNITPGEEEVKLVMKKTEEQISAKERDPFTQFRNRVTELHFGNSYFFRPLKRSDLSHIDPLKACEYFNNCFKDPSTFAVAIVGKIDPTSALPLIQQYLAGIPKPSEPICHHKCDYVKGLPFNFPTTIVREEVISPMKGEQCRVALSFPVELMKETMGKEQWYLHFMQELFKMKILQVLRFQHGQIYSTEVSYYLNGDKPYRTDTRRGFIRIAFSCDPNMSSTLVDMALDEISRLQEGGPSDQEFSTILENGQRYYENGLQDNNYWLNEILGIYYAGINFEDVGTSFEDNNYWLNKILDIYYSGINFEDVGTSSEVHEGLSGIRESYTQLEMKLAMQRILPFPCKKQYTAVILMPQPCWLQ